MYRIGFDVGGTSIKVGAAITICRLPPAEA